MIGNKVLKNLMTDPWDRYRDLDKVFKHTLCKKNNFNSSNTLLMDAGNAEL
jgi:hypothetical protein